MLSFNLGNMNFRSKDLEKTAEYVKNRIKGLNKKDSALEAGYALNTAENAIMIEKGQNYKILAERTNAITTMNMNAIIERMRVYIAENKPTMEIKALAEVFQKLAQAQKILTPEIRVRESQDKDGNTKRTIWATGNTIPQASTPIENNPE